MKTQLAGLALLLSLGAAVTFADSSPKAEAPAAAVVEGVLGTRVVDLRGAIHQLGGDGIVRPSVFIFIGTECPISNRYAPRLNEIAAAAKQHDVPFYGIVSDASITRAAASKHQEEFDLRFPILFDGSGELARRLAPTHVPECFLLGTRGELTYRGRIDDRFHAVGKPNARVSSHDLMDAVTAVAAGKTPATSRTQPVGCIFESGPPAAEPATVTYNRDVAPILNANCVSCHRPGQVAPFPLQSYEHAQKRARMIAKVCRDEIMPPWRATPGYGHFGNAKDLGDREVAVLEAWAKAGAPRGNPEDLPPAPEFPNTTWELGEPDIILTMPEPFEIPAEGDDIYRYFVIPIDIPEDRMIVGYQFVPGNPAVVHHSICYVDTSGKARELDAKHDGPGYPAYFGQGGPSFTPEGTAGGWAPGSPAYRHPEGWGDRLRKGSDLVLEIHYHLNGKATTDQSSLGLYFAKKPVKQVGALVIGTFDIDIPAGAKNYRRQAWMELPYDVTLVDVSPHMHNLATECKITATEPGGKEIPLLWIENWDFRWQDFYIYAEPVRLVKGTRIDVHITYDNSRDNPANPNDPPQRVKWGWQTTDEMGEAYFTVLPDHPSHVDWLFMSSLQSYARSAKPEK